MERRLRSFNALDHRAEPFVGGRLIVSVAIGNCLSYLVLRSL